MLPHALVEILRGRLRESPGRLWIAPSRNLGNRYFLGNPSCVSENILGRGVGHRQMSHARYANCRSSYHPLSKPFLKLPFFFCRECGVPNFDTCARLVGENEGMKSPKSLEPGENDVLGAWASIGLEQIKQLFLLAAS